MTHHLARAALTAVLAAALLAPTTHAKAPSRDDQRQLLVKLLGSPELPLERRVLDTIGPDVNALLVEVAGHPRSRKPVRLRAVATLRHYPAKITRSYLTSLLYERSLRGDPFGDRLRGQAAESLAHAFGEAVVNDLLPLREDTDPGVRAAAARALGATDSRHALPILTTWLSQENVLHVRVAVDDAITAIAER